VSQPFVWNTWEEALKFALLPTTYEQNKGITLIDYKIVVDGVDLKVFLANKSDKTQTLGLVMKKAKTKNLWINWIPSDLQFEMFSLIGKLYYSLDKHNGRVKK